MAGTKLWSIVAVMMICTAARGAAATAPNCTSATADISSCVTYLTAGTPAPSMVDECCKGVQNLYSQVQTTEDRQSVCGCLKEEANEYNLNDNALASLAPNCGVSLSFTITKDIDCSKIH